MDAQSNAAWSAFEETQGAASEYNQAVDAANAVVAAKKTATGAADVKTVEAALTRLRATKTRFEPDAKRACDEHILAQLEKTAVEKNKAAVRKQLDEYTEQIIGRYAAAINGLLDEFNAGFRLTGFRHAYPGGVAAPRIRFSSTKSLWILATTKRLATRRVSGTPSAAATRALSP